LRSQKTKWFTCIPLSSQTWIPHQNTLSNFTAKVVRSARYITFKLCSSCPYKEEFYDTLSAIGKLDVQLE